MKAVAILLNDMVRTGVISNYAVFGAVAQMRYTEAVVTQDADILVAVPHPEALDALTPIYTFCRERGYRPEGEAIRVGDWPVQLIPAFSQLTEAAMRDAETGDIDGIPLRVVRADYLAVIALGSDEPRTWHASLPSVRQAPRPMPRLRTWPRGMALLTRGRHSRSVSVNVDIVARLAKQAAWQRSRAADPWAEKLRTSVAMRAALKFMKRTRNPPAATTLRKFRNP